MAFAYLPIIAALSKGYKPENQTDHHRFAEHRIRNAEPIDSPKKLDDRKTIYEEELKGENRAEYGAKIIAKLSKALTLEFGKGFGKTSLYQFYSFYKCYPNIFHSNGKPSLLTWTHCKFLITVLDPKARDWYENECLARKWTVRVLQRDIDAIETKCAFETRCGSPTTYLFLIF